MVIRVLTFEGCPNCEATIRLVEETVNELHLEAQIEAVRVEEEDAAKKYGFLGSPSIQVDGRDIETSRRNENASFACRVYRTPNGLSGVPPKSLLLAALREAHRRA